MTDHREYTLRIHTDLDPATADERVRDALAEQGFGILTEIDVQAAMKDKLGEELPPYRILGACNPRLAHRAIGTDVDIGALLPCNVVVRADPDGGSEIVAADPAAMLLLSPKADELRDIADEARTRIQNALDTVAG